MVDYAKVQSKVTLKYDYWHKEVSIDSNNYYSTFYCFYFFCQMFFVWLLNRSHIEYDPLVGTLCRR